MYAEVKWLWPFPLPAGGGIRKHDSDVFFARGRGACSFCASARRALAEIELMYCCRRERAGIVYIFIKDEFVIFIRVLAVVTWVININDDA